jgi:hypothetical protein
MVWRPARWVSEGGAWVFYDGYWVSSDPDDPNVAYQPPAPPLQPVVVTPAPPPPLVEMQPPAPYANAVWVPGYWWWNGARHVWISGRWSARPDGYEWRRHHWDHRDDGRWVHRPGYWEHHDDEDHDRGEHRGRRDKD